MAKLLVLCCDGLDFEEMIKYDVRLNHNRLSIPDELCLYGSPYTPDVWGSMFLGEIWNHPDRDSFGHKKTPRTRVRGFLRSRGIKWERKGWNIKFGEANDTEFKDFVASNKVVTPLARPNLLDKFNSFHFRVPSVSHGFYFGSVNQVREFHQVFRVLVRSAHIFSYDIFVVYTNIFDHLGHYKMDQSGFYLDLVMLIRDFQDYNPNVVVLSDHATRDANHLDYAYMGSYASPRDTVESVEDVANFIEKYARVLVQ